MPLRLVVGGRWLEGVIPAERVTVPAKPFKLESVIVEVAWDPRGIVRVVGLAEIAKSAVLNTAV